MNTRPVIFALIFSDLQLQVEIVEQRVSALLQKNTLQYLDLFAASCTHLIEA